MRTTAPTSTDDANGHNMALPPNLRRFIGQNQLAALDVAFRSEKRQFFCDRLVKLAEIVGKMPTIGQQEMLGVKAIVSLHYLLVGGGDCWVMEKDSEPSDMPGLEMVDQGFVGGWLPPTTLLTHERLPGHHQAFVLADLGLGATECGYISIEQMVKGGGAELDLHFKPCTLEEVYFLARNQSLK